MAIEFVDPETYIKPIGIIGGRGTLATDNIAGNIQREAKKILPWGLPTIRRDFPASLLTLNTDGTISDPPRASQRLLSIVAEVSSQCEFFIITAHAPDLSRKDIEAFSGRKSSYLSMVDTALEAVFEKSNLNTVGVLGYSSATLPKRIYQQPLEEMGIECVTIPDEQSTRLDNAIDEVVENGGPIEDLAPEVESACINLLYIQGAQAIILACSELPLVLDLLKIVDRSVLINPNQLVAQAAVKQAVSLLQKANYPFS